MKKKVLPVLAGIFIALGITASAELYCENTPTENIFYVQDKGFILLDKTQVNGEDAYLVLAKDFYDPRYYGGVADDASSSASWDKIDHYFDVNGTYDPYNVGLWLNTEFIGRRDGSGLPVSGEKAMADYIPSAVWRTEACAPGSKAPVTQNGPNITKYYDVNAKIVLPSCEELNRYADKIGYHDGADIYWWTRSRFYGYNDIKIVSVVNPQNGAFGYRNGGKNLTRPIFYLTKNFFLNIPIDADTVGKKVRDVIKSDFTEEELLQIYTQNEMDILLLDGVYKEPTSVMQDSRVYVYGSIDTTYKNRNVSVMALKKGTDSNAPLPAQILYLNQTAVDNNGRYELIFDTKLSQFDLYISDGGLLKKQLPIKDYTQKHYIRCELSDAEYVENYAYRVMAQVKNAFADSNAVCDIYFTMYDEANVLCRVEKRTIDLSGDGEVRSEELQFETDNRVAHVKAFVWSELVPLNEEQSLLDADLNQFAKLTVSPYKKGNIYTDSDEISFKLNGEIGKTIRYTLYDFWNNAVDTGTFILMEADTRWVLPNAHYGYFTLDFKYEYYDINNTVSQYLCIVTDENFDNVEDSPFAVNAHLEWTQYGFDARLVHDMALMGARSIRTGYSWAGVETQKGVYTINQAGLAEMRQHNMRMNLVTGYGNSLYSGQKWFPWSDEGRKAFSDYQLGVMEYVSDLVDELDVWNEWYGGGDSNNWYYYKLLEACWAPFKAKYPHVQVLGNSATDSAHNGWYNKLLGFGAAKYMDGIYPHIYYHNSTPEQEILAAKTFYNNIHAKYKVSNLKMYLTETGATTATTMGVSEAEQASRVVRAYAVGLSCGYEKIYWYDFLNDGSTLSEREHNFGLIRSNYDVKGAFTPKPAYVAYAVMARQLTGYTCKGLTMLGANSDIYSVRFEKGGEVVHVIWSLNGQTFNLGETHTVTDIMGSTGETATLQLNQYPVYVRGEL